MRASLQASDFAVRNEQKAQTINRIRSNVYPELIADYKGAEDALLKLHLLGTENTKPKGDAPIPRAMDILKRSGLVENPNIKLANQALKDPNCEYKVDLAPITGGRYRLQGSVTHNGTTHKVWIPRAVEITRLGKRAEAFYTTPTIGVDSLMASLCKAFDELDSTTMRSEHKLPEYVAIMTAFFYAIGIRLIHPFKDGNHRAFDRFIELTFARYNIPIELPQDATLNIPPNVKIRPTLMSFVTNFHTNTGLPLSFIPKNIVDDSMHELLVYKFITQLIGVKLDAQVFFAFYMMVAKEFLSWVPGHDLSLIDETITDFLQTSGIQMVTINSEM